MFASGAAGAAPAGGDGWGVGADGGGWGLGGGGWGVGGGGGWSTPRARGGAGAAAWSRLGRGRSLRGSGAAR
ncbi:MAG: hypothetical protein C0513_06365 [Isosphaera sp.]|nr:hypothetical protein [Isosphaera sp.]